MTSLSAVLFARFPGDQAAVARFPTACRLRPSRGVVSSHILLYARLVPGEQESLAAAAFRDHQGAIYRFLLRKTGNRDEAEELTQVVFTEATSALQSPAEPPTSTRAWLYSIAERRFIDHVRKRVVARRALRLLERFDEAPDEAQAREIARAILAAMKALPEEQRQVVTMKVLEGKRFAEIAVELGTTEAAAKMRMSRAITKIKSELESQGLKP